MSNFLGIFDDDEKENLEDEDRLDHDDHQTDGSLQLHKEEVDVAKHTVDAGEVVLSKEVIEEQKSVDVPVMHEEVLITRTPMHNERCDEPITSEDTETIHIPVSKEEVEVNKYTVITEEISASKHQVDETQHFQETLKHEEAHLDTKGNIDVISRDSGFEDINNS